MAKRKGPNKSEAIREYYRNSPGAKPKEIVLALKKKGITVSAQQVSTCRMNAIKNGLLVDQDSKVKQKKAAKGPKRLVRRANSTAAFSADISIEDLVAAKKLVSQMGGLEKAQHTITALSKILD